MRTFALWCQNPSLCTPDIHPNHLLVPLACFINAALHSRQINVASEHNPGDYVCHHSVIGKTKEQISLRLKFRSQELTWRVACCSVTACSFINTQPELFSLHFLSLELFDFLCISQSLNDVLTQQTNNRNVFQLCFNVFTSCCIKPLKRLLRLLSSTCSCKVCGHLKTTQPHVTVEHLNRKPSQKCWMGWGQGSVQASQVLPHQTGQHISLWSCLCTAASSSSLRNENTYSRYRRILCSLSCCYIICIFPVNV